MEKVELEAKADASPAEMQVHDDASALKHTTGHQTDGCWLSQCATNAFECMSQSFGRLGGYMGENPWRFVVGMFIFAVILAGGLAVLEQEGRPEELWVPKDSEAADDRDIVDGFFPQTSRISTVMITADDGDMTTPANFNAMLTVYYALANATASYDSSLYDWDGNNGGTAICTMAGSTYCRSVNPLEPFNYVVPTTQAGILSVLNSVPDGSARLLTMRWGAQSDSTGLLGGITYNSNGDITAASAAKLIFSEKNDRVRSSKGGWESPKAEAWEESWLNVAEGLSVSGITVTRFAARTRRDEFSVCGACSQFRIIHFTQSIQFPHFVRLKQYLFPNLTSLRPKVPR